MESKLFPRTVFGELKKYLATGDIIVLHGARQVGKTSILYYLKDFLDKDGKKTYYIDLEDSRMVSLMDSGADEFLAYLKEKGLIAGQKNQELFVLIDEIQYLKNPSSFLKLLADHHPSLKLIVSGSSSFGIKSKFKDSLAGRTVNFEILPLSFEEFLIFKNQSTAVLGQKTITDKTLEELHEFFREYILYGGYPKIVLEKNIELKEKYLQQIIDTYIRKDIRDLAEIKESDKFNKLLEVLAAQSGCLLDLSELSGTCKLARQTVENYLFILENTYVIKILRPFYKNIRAELFKTPKVFFYDTGLMQMLWLKQLQREIVGSAFETGIFGELAKIYGQSNIYYWRTADKKEIDFIVRHKNKILPIEAKLNFEKFNKTACEYFSRHYAADYVITALKGDKKDGHYKYPWELRVN